MARNWKGKTMAVSMSALLAVTATACASGDSGGGAGEGGGDNEVVTLTMMHPWTLPNVDNDIYKERIAKFEAEHPNIKIKQDGVGSNQYKTKLQTLAAGKNMPALSVVWPSAELAPFVEADILQPINEIADTWEGLLPDAAKEGYTIDGNLYAVPTKQTFVDIVYYNKQMFADIGYDEFPATYEELIDAINKFKEAGITPISNGNKDKWPLQSSYMSILVDRFGGPGFLEKIINKEAKFTDEDFIKALGVIAEFTELGAFNTDMNSMDTVQAQDYFIQEKAAMHITSSTVNSRIREDNEEGDKFGIALFPSVPEGKGDPGTSSGIIQFGVAVKKGLSEQEQAAAFEFLKFFYSEELYTELMANSILVPASIEMPEDASPYIQEMYGITREGNAPVFDSMVSAQIKDTIENGLQAITIGQSTPEKVAEDLQAILDRSN